LRNPPGGGKVELVGGNSPLLLASEILILETRIPYRLAEPGFPPPNLVRPRLPRGTGTDPTTGHVESESLDAESRLPAQTT
jgi:hypothetical protein